jgi:hypothetical protein
MNGANATQQQKRAHSQFEKVTVMVRIQQSAKQIWVAIAASLVTSAVAANGTAADFEPEVSGVRLQVDNDLFAGGQRDRDYTGGFAFTLAGTDARDRYLSLDPLLTKLDEFTSPIDAGSTHHARQVGMVVFTPRDVLSREAIQNDRPYASLLFTTNARVRVEPDNRTAWSSSLTVGALGLSATESIHDAVHSVVGSENPKGYDHQISAGGEPTARYTLARHYLVVANPSGNVDVKATVQGSVGYLTETSAALTMRFGRFDTPWWSFAPELTDYIAAPVPVDARRSRPEVYMFAGVRVKARAYNAFLQGQFRHSDVKYSFDELEPVLAEAWVGFATQLFEQTQVSYTLNYQTAEIRKGPAARDYVWGAVQLSHSF